MRCSVLLPPVQDPLRLASFSRCQGEALGCAKRVIREEWPQRVGVSIHEALQRQPFSDAPALLGDGDGSQPTGQVKNITKRLRYK